MGGECFIDELPPGDVKETKDPAPSHPNVDEPDCSSLRAEKNQHGKRVCEEDTDMYVLSKKHDGSS